MKLDPVAVARGWHIFNICGIIFNTGVTIAALINGAWLLAAWGVWMTILGLVAYHGTKLKLMRAKHKKLNQYEPL